MILANNLKNLTVEIKNATATRPEIDTISKPL